MIWTVWGLKRLPLKFYYFVYDISIVCVQNENTQGPITTKGTHLHQPAVVCNYKLQTYRSGFFFSFCFLNSLVRVSVQIKKNYLCHILSLPIDEMTLVGIQVTNIWVSEILNIPCCYFCHLKDLTTFQCLLPTREVHSRKRSDRRKKKDKLQVGYGSINDAFHGGYSKKAPPS